MGYAVYNVRNFLKKNKKNKNKLKIPFPLVFSNTMHCFVFVAEHFVLVSLKCSVRP